MVYLFIYFFKFKKGLINWLYGSVTASFMSREHYFQILDYVDNGSLYWSNSVGDVYVKLFEWTKFQNTEQKHLELIRIVVD